MVVGRGTELTRVDELLDAVRAGDGAALHFVAEAGVGKTAVLDEVAHRACAGGGFTVVRASGVESEASLPFAVIRELVDAAGADLASVPVLRNALEPPGDGWVPGDRRGVFAEFLALLVRVAAERPLCLVVDDVHWSDDPSFSCLLHAAQHVAGTHVAMVVAGRPEDRGATRTLGARVDLEPLGRQDARRVLQAVAPALGERRTTTVLDLAGGNPLALVELAVTSNRTDDAAAGVRGARSVLDAALRARLTGLSAPESTAVLAVAVASDVRAAPTVAAAGDRGALPTAFEALERNRLITVDGDGLRLTHPLIRSAVLDAASPADRRAMHAALAERTEGSTRAWHLASAAFGYDEEAAEALEVAALDATVRGAHESAADALERAAELSPDPDGRAQRLGMGGLAAGMGGQLDRASSMLERAAETDDAQLRASVLHLDSMISLVGGLKDAAANRLRLEAEAQRIREHDADLATSMQADAAVVAVVAGDLRAMLASSSRALAMLDGLDDDTVNCQVHAIHGLALALQGHTSAARKHLDLAGDLLPEVDPLMPAAQSILLALGGRICTGQTGLLREEAVRMESAAQATQSVGLLPYFELQAADSALRLGDLEAAARDSASAVASAEVANQPGPLAMALAIGARVQATRGEVPQARRTARQGLALSREIGYLTPEIWNLAALGFAELTAGRAGAAVAQLEPVAQLAADIGLADPVIVPWAPDLVEALVANGDQRTARVVAERLSEQAEQNGTDHALACAARSRAWARVGNPAEEVAAALAGHERASLPFELARTQWCRGVLARQTRRDRDARESLSEALDAFEAMGAAAWARRASAELRRAGARTVVSTDEPTRLTAHERRIASAVAAGATNREIAEEIQVSAKTIEYHLTRIYRKLHIRSRAELAALVVSGAGRSDAEVDPV